MDEFSVRSSLVSGYWELDCIGIDSRKGGTTFLLLSGFVTPVIFKVSLDA